MGVNSSRTQVQLDAATGVTLKASGTVTSTTAETAISLSELNLAWWSNYEIPHGKFVVAVDVSDGLLDADSGWDDETYVISLLVDDVVAMNNSPVTVASETIHARGCYELVVNSRDIPLLDSDHNGGDKFLQVKATLGGGEPTLTYAAWIAKSLGA